MDRGCSTISGRRGNGGMTATECGPGRPAGALSQNVLTLRSMLNVIGNRVSDILQRVGGGSKNDPTARGPDAVSLNSQLGQMAEDAAVVGKMLDELSTLI